MLMGDNGNTKLFHKYSDHVDNFDYKLSVLSLMTEITHTSIKCMAVCRNCGCNVLPKYVTFFSLRDIKGYMKRNIYHTKKECDNVK